MIFKLENYTSQNHNCTLQTILNLEEFIQKSSGTYSKTQLWENLPKKIMYQSYKVILGYLESQNKVYFSKKKVFWNPSFNSFDLSQFESQRHNPTLQTLLSIEEFFNKNSNIYSKTQGWENLPKKIMYQSYKVILKFLEYSKKIRFERKKVISIELDVSQEEIEQSIRVPENYLLDSKNSIINNNKGDLNSSTPPPRNKESEVYGGKKK